VAAAAPLFFKAVSAGANHTCAIASSGLAYCWGYNGSGELGNGTTTSSNKPVLVSGGLHFVQISAGTEYTCGISTSNLAYCWGDVSNSKLGTGSNTGTTVPAPVAGGRHFRLIRAGYDHTCAVTPYDVGFCWGRNRFGEVGANSTTSVFPTPVRVVGGLSFRRIVAGGHFSCGVTTSNRAYCWGHNDGAVGDGTTTDRRRPVPVLGGLQFRSVVAGGGGFTDEQNESPEEEHACGVTTDSKGYCWGRNADGELGAGGNTRNQTRPVAISGNRRWQQVVAGDRHTCGVTTANVAFCWGENLSGQNGDGTTTRSFVPVPVAGGLAFTNVTTGPGPDLTGSGPTGNHSCGLTPANRVYCWGDNEAGQLGDATNTRRLTPVAVVGP
jgi:alpha-tubulin suppressor-like RCC1 family protein